MVSKKYRGNLDSRFINLKPGFNFNYGKGNRPNSGFLLLSKGNPQTDGLPSIELWDLNRQVILKNGILMKLLKKLKVYQAKIFFISSIL